MESSQIILLLITIAVLFIVFKIIYDGVIKKKKIFRQLQRSYGALAQNDYSAPRYEGIGYYYKNKEKTTPVIDDITWNDLDMETIYMILNNTGSGIGEEYLYALLHMPCTEDTLLKERDRIANYMDSHEEERVKLQYELKKLGKLRTSSIGQYLANITTMRPHSPALHVTLLSVFVLVVAGCFVNPAAFLPPLFIVLIINMVTYFSYKGKISSYFAVFSYLSRMTQTAVNIEKQSCQGISEYNKELRECLKPLKKISKYAWLFISGVDFSADLIALVMDYVKMITHIDLIIFDIMVNSIDKNKVELNRIMDIMGEIDSDIAIASYRRYMDGQVCTPELSKDGPLEIKTENIYHPMIVKPVKNSLKEEKSVLLTGSNASGKSTFLKTIAINAIFAQTIYTCLADSYKSRYYKIYSSMALQDNIQGSESYYIVEIKSLKRIIDAAGGLDEALQKDSKNDGIPVLCFIDEVLRGTNTVERIAASSRILHALAHKNALCFAATHDIELTTILAKTYSNYHFQEEVSDNDVLFDYKLYKGRATSRNAIKLISIIGFNHEITNEATEAARLFEEDGSWVSMK